ncbi:MAG TPA: Asp23/Gls24 family envelope stress response protein [Bacillota bacterium]|nr:Asp23/Gls24 family envelope stress response protein [Bacillota bacterium]
MNEIIGGNVITNELGKIIFAEDFLAELASQAAVECYGLVGMASRKLKDGIAELLRRENYSRGVKISIVNQELVIDLFVIVSYGTRIPEVASNVMEKVKFAVESTTGLSVAQVNVNVQGIQVGAKH